jgi:hypothetical protein
MGHDEEFVKPHVLRIIEALSFLSILEIVFAWVRNEVLRAFCASYGNHNSNSHLVYPYWSMSSLLFLYNKEGFNHSSERYINHKN